MKKENGAILSPEESENFFRLFLPLLQAVNTNYFPGMLPLSHSCRKREAIYFAAHRSCAVGAGARAAKTA